MHVAGHVKRDIADAAVVAGQGRIHELVADQPAVHVQVEETEAANVGRRPPNLFGDLEVMPQYSCGQAAVVAPGELAPGGRAERARGLGQFPLGVVEAFLFPASDLGVGRAPVRVGRKKEPPGLFSELNC